MDNKESVIRVYIIYFLVLFLSVAVVCQIFYLQIYRGDELSRQAEKQVFDTRTIKAPRGNIYAENEQKTSLALSVPRYKVYVDFKVIDSALFFDNINALSDSLSSLLYYKSPEKWKKLFKAEKQKKSQFFFVARGLRNDQIERLKKFPIFNRGKYNGGCIVLKNNQRAKPYGMLANRTIGRVYEDKDPIAGLENAFNQDLKGQDGHMLMEKIRGNEWKPVDDDFSVDPMPGNDIYTSIDINIQDVAHSALLNQLTEQKAQRGCVVLMDVKTGFVKAIANLTRDTNTGSYSETLNHAVGLASEPGSTFKLASLLVAIEDGKIKISDSVNMSGRYRFYDQTLTDGGKVYGKNTIQQAFEKSSNVISQLIFDNYKDSPQDFIDGLKKIGLHKKLGLKIKGEGVPYIKEANDPLFSGITLPWMSIGYEVEVTPLQTLALYNAVANDGVMVRPQFVKSIRQGNDIIKTFEPYVLNPSICSASTLNDLKIMLKGVVERGTAKNIKARGFDIAGKTGTSKIAQGSKGYGDKYQASFCGYFPAKTPKYSCIVVIQGPTKNIYGSKVSGTVFKEIADKVYAQEFEKKQKEIKVEKLNYPFSRPGNKNDFLIASKQMGIPVVQEYKDTTCDWINTRAGKDGIKIKSRNIVNALVPNVIGMGLEDALYLLEKNGLVVQSNGSGFVRDQSISPGLKILIGQKIILELG
tara:strand:+ start:1927 stop:4014 length:2088 start_codon:yes stop_codon:yes gene_type:complete